MKMSASAQTTARGKGIDLEISFMQTVGCILVVAEHSFNYMDGPIYLCKYVYQFSMPLFVFLSGYLLRHGLMRRDTSAAEIRMTGRNGFIAKKAKRLLVPYLVLNTAAFIPKALLADFAMRPVDMSLGQYVTMLAYPYHNVVGTLWFLFTIFMILVIAMACLKLKARLGIRVHPVAIIALLAVINIVHPYKEIIFNIHAIMEYMVFMAAGYYARGIDFKKRMAPHAATVFWVTFPLTFVLALTPDVPGRQLVTAANGISMMTAAAIIYNRHGLHMINHLYGKAYTIYIYSWFVQVFFLQIMMKATGLPGPAASALAITGGVYLPYFLYKWIMAHKDKTIGKCLAIVSGI